MRLPNSNKRFGWGIWVAIIVVVVAITANTANSAPGQISGDTEIEARSGEILVYDTWVGERLRFDYSRCQAVAGVRFKGVYDYVILPDGSLDVYIGLTHVGNSITIIVDGLYRQCPAW